MPSTRILTSARSAYCYFVELSDNICDFEYTHKAKTTLPSQLFDMKIAGRTFVVSGGCVLSSCINASFLNIAYYRASGLGRATIQNLVQAGGYVSILDMNEDGGQELVKELGPDRSRFLQVDVSDTESLAEAVKGTLLWVKETGKELGGVIAAAGVSTPAKIVDRHGDPFEMKGFDFVMNINVRGSIDLVRQLLPHMTKVEPEAPDGERGIIVLVSSSAAYIS